MLVGEPLEDEINLPNRTLHLQPEAECRQVQRMAESRKQSDADPKWQREHSARVRGGITSRTPESERYMAESYRLRTQAVADYMNAVPVPTWASYVVAIGAAVFGAGSATLAATRGATASDWAATITSWALGLALVVYGLLSLRWREEERHAKYVEGRSLFDEWAKAVNQPFPGGGSIQYGVEDFFAGATQLGQVHDSSESDMDEREQPRT